MSAAGTGELVRVFDASAGRPSVGSHVRDVWRSRDLLVALTRSQRKASHVAGALGQVWHVLDPLLQAVVYFLLVGILRGGERGTPERLSLIIGCMFLFSFTSGAVTGAGRSISANARLLQNAVFPRMVLPLTVVLRSALDLVPSLAVYAVVHVLADRPVEPVLLLLPLLVALQALFTLGIALITATGGVYFADLPNYLSYVTRLWMLVTPVIWVVGDPPPAVRHVLVWNPLYPVFAAYQAILGGAAPTAGQLAGASAWAAVALAAGVATFLRHERELAARV